MRAGLLDKRIDLYKLVIADEGYGYNSNSYEKKRSCWANFRDNSGNRLMENGEVFFSHNVTFKVRDFINVEDTDQIRYKGNKYRILNINPSDSEHNIIITAEKINE